METTNGKLGNEMRFYMNNSIIRNINRIWVEILFLNNKSNCFDCKEEILFTFNVNKGFK